MGVVFIPWNPASRSIDLRLRRALVKGGCSWGLRNCRFWSVMMLKGWVNRVLPVAPLHE